jgi:hypothetical protein
MHTEQLIEQLAASRPPRARPRLRIAAAVTGGWLLALAGLLIVFGLPLQEVDHTGMAPLAVKLGYALALACLSAAAAMASGRPGSSVGKPVALIAVPVALLLVIAALELTSASTAARPAMLFGSEYASCVVSVALASVPVLLGLLWAFRILAPTRLAAAGFLIGLTAGSAGAAAFALYCHETTAAFLLAAYTPAILIPAAIGALAARPLLKW